MMAKRTVLLGMLICVTGAVAFGQPAVIAPNAGGDIGLFTMPTADSPRAGQFTLGFYGWYLPRTAGEIYTGQPTNTRHFVQWGGSGSMGLGLTNWWSVFVAGGAQEFRSGGGWQGGTIHGVLLPGSFSLSGGSKVRVGTKISVHSEADPDLRIAGWFSGLFSIGNTNISNEQGDITTLNTGKSDWEWGAAVSKSVFTGMVSYTLVGQPTDAPRIPNILVFGLGTDIPIVPLIHLIFEGYYTVLDGGDLPEPDYGTLNAGARIWFGKSGWALSAALNTNLNMLFDHGINPDPFGGYLGITYAAWPPPPPPPVVVPAAAEPIVEEPAPAPAPQAEVAPSAPPPPRPAPKTTTDEIYFDGRSARLTNIAKAVLDGVALRMKNDLNATAVITGYTDNTGSEQSNIELGTKRSDAAKQYLVTRHGIDPGRISTSSKGAAEPAYDNSTAEGRAKNRRAQIVVTLISGM
jgi:outer membrane protein OmpA-like peptidoglycan-associated protein